MGEQRIREVNMVTLIFLLLGVVFLFAVVGRIWIDPAPGDSHTIDSVAVNNPGEPVTLNNISESKDSVV